MMERELPHFLVLLHRQTLVRLDPATHQTPLPLDVTDVISTNSPEPDFVPTQFDSSSLTEFLLREVFGEDDNL